MLPHEQLNSDKTTIDDPSSVAQALGNLAVISGSLGCASVLFGFMISEGLFLGGGGMSVLALFVGYFSYIRSKAARLMLLLGLFGLIVGGVTDSEFPGYVGLAVSLVALFVGYFGGRNAGPAKAGMLVGLCGTLAFLGVCFSYVLRPQEPPSPSRIEAEETSEPALPRALALPKAPAKRDR
jgi:hypothetical protein